MRKKTQFIKDYKIVDNAYASTKVDLHCAYKNRTLAIIKFKASLFAFQYSDYLQLFLLIGLCANEDNILVTTSDVIQSNMQLKREDFLMKQAYTCLQLDVDLEVKPILMRFPFMSDQTDSAIKKSSWYTIHYHGVQGYN